MAKYKLSWRGSEILEEVMLDVVAPALGEAGLRVETSSKRKLRGSRQARRPKSKRIYFIRWGGRGLQTGTLRRSIHTASPGYSWSGDDTKPTTTSPERGGVEHKGDWKDGKIAVEIGSGMKYAIYVHQDHYNPDVLHFIVRSIDDVRPQIPSILDKYKLRR